jgi:hypothetical protein
MSLGTYNYAIVALVNVFASVFKTVTVWKLSTSFAFATAERWIAIRLRYQKYPFRVSALLLIRLFACSTKYDWMYTLSHEGCLTSLNAAWLVQLHCYDQRCSSQHSILHSKEFVNKKSSRKKFNYLGDEIHSKKNFLFDRDFYIGYIST